MVSELVEPTSSSGTSESSFAASAESSMVMTMAFIMGFVSFYLLILRVFSKNIFIDGSNYDGWRIFRLVNLDEWVFVGLSLFASLTIVEVIAN